jgi:lactate racemase
MLSFQSWFLLSILCEVATCTLNWPTADTGLPLDLPDDWPVTVVAPRYVPALPDPAAALTGALRAPRHAPALAERVKPGDRVGIVFSDITRATPHHLILPAVLAELQHIPREHITLFNALGTHRPTPRRSCAG